MTTPITLTRQAANEAAMQALGHSLAEIIVPGCVIYLQGNLGAGKTTFVRGFLRGLGITGKVKSPTYTLVEPYDTEKFEIFHFDLYRLKQPQELQVLDLDAYFTPNSICLIEWPAHGGQYLPPADLIGDFDILKDTRQIRFAALTKSGEEILARL